MDTAQTILLSVAKDFSQTPGSRAREEGDHSGQQFLEDVLLPKYEQARKLNVKLFVNLDGTEGYATSFLEAAFGELARRFDQREILDTLQFKSDDEPYLVKEITRYIEDARRKR